VRGRILAGVIGALLAFSVSPAFAADATAPATSIRSVDTDQFPVVKVTVSTPGSTTLSSDDVHATENGKPVSAVAVQPEDSLVTYPASTNASFMGRRFGAI
jgi:hypothetical protein